VGVARERVGRLPSGCWIASSLGLLFLDLGGCPVRVAPLAAAFESSVDEVQAVPGLPLGLLQTGAQRLHIRPIATLPAAAPVNHGCLLIPEQRVAEHFAAVLGV